MKLKILHVIHSLSVGGMENGLVNIINGSPERFEHEICCVTEADDFITRVKHPIRYYELHKREGNDLSLVLRLKRIFQESKVNVVHTRNWGAFDGILAACLTPGITVVHGEHGRDSSDPNGLNSRRNRMRRWLSFRVRKFIAVSNDLQRWLRDIVGIPPEKILLIPNGVNTQRFKRFPDSTLRQELRIGPDEFLVGCIGRLDPVKNHAGLIRAVERLKDEGTSIRVLIVGDGPERASLEQQIASFGGTLRPILAGNRGDVERFYGAFDLFVLNSSAEGMSNTLLEAMASGLPVVCTAVGGNLELVSDGISGKLVPVADDGSLAQAIKLLISRGDLRHQYGTEAKEFVSRNHSLEGMVQKYLWLYDSLLATKS
jgi:sugar transferase (PEP-CTERM/EpsH1 system associated)